MNSTGQKEKLKHSTLIGILNQIRYQQVFNIFIVA